MSKIKQRIIYALASFEIFFGAILIVLPGVIGYYFNHGYIIGSVNDAFVCSFMILGFLVGFPLFFTGLFAFFIFKEL